MREQTVLSIIVQTQLVALFACCSLVKVTLSLCFTGRSSNRTTALYLQNSKLQCGFCRNRWSITVVDIWIASHLKPPISAVPVEIPINRLHLQNGFVSSGLLQICFAKSRICSQLLANLN